MKNQDKHTPITKEQWYEGQVVLRRQIKTLENQVIKISDLLGELVQMLKDERNRE